MLNFLCNFFYFCISANILVLIHEFGHFLAAKKFKITVTKFSIGLGYPILEWYDKKLTKYQISIFPFGGYVEIYEKKSHGNCSAQRIVTNYCGSIIWKRIIVIISGSIFNIFFSILVFWIISFTKPCYRPIVKKIIPYSIAEQVGILPGMEIQLENPKSILDWHMLRLHILKNMYKKNISVNMNVSQKGKKEHKNIVIFLKDLKNNSEKDLIYELGIIPLIPKKEFFISKIDTNSSDTLSQLKIGDQLVKFNNKELCEWQYVLEEINKSSNGGCYTIEVNRNDKIYKIDLKLGKKGDLGFQVKELISFKDKYLIQKLSFFDSLIYSLRESWYLICIVKNILINCPEQLISSIRGPIFIGGNSIKSMKLGIISYLAFLSTLSINMGVINLFPIPILDGGNLLFFIIKEMMGKLNLKKMCNVYNYIGFICLSFLLGIALFNDFIHIN